MFSKRLQIKIWYLIDSRRRETVCFRNYLLNYKGKKLLFWVIFCDLLFFWLGSLLRDVQVLLKILFSSCYGGKGLDKNKRWQLRSISVSILIDLEKFDLTRRS